MATVKFSNTIQGSSIDHLFYNFGDGTTFSTTDQTVYHNYLLQGDYTYTLNAFYDASNFKSISYPISVHW